MDNEHDRLAMIESLGGVLVRTAAGEGCAIHDNGYAGSQGEGGFETSDSSPQLTTTTPTAARLRLNVRGTEVSVRAPCVPEKRFRVRNEMPDGTGMSTILLDALA